MKGGFYKVQFDEYGNIKKATSILNQTLNKVV